jgi:hypothetical protein
MDPQTQQQFGQQLPQLPPTGPPNPVGGMMPAPAALVAQPIAPSASPTVANDLDLIEKEWVEKAKAIVSKTRTDPHTQNDEMNKFKADYMKKRYGKDIKIEG